MHYMGRNNQTQDIPRKFQSSPFFLYLYYLRYTSYVSKHIKKEKEKVQVKILITTQVNMCLAEC